MPWPSTQGALLQLQVILLESAVAGIGNTSRVYSGTSQRCVEGVNSNILPESADRLTQQFSMKFSCLSEYCWLASHYFTVYGAAHITKVLHVGCGVYMLSIASHLKALRRLSHMRVLELQVS